jgi:pantothenate kinase
LVAPVPPGGGAIQGLGALLSSARTSRKISHVAPVGARIEVKF